MALAVLDADGKPLAGNDALTELLGADAAALWSATVGVGPVALARMVALLAEQPSVEVATRLRAGASDERDVRLAARRGDDGKVVVAVHVLPARESVSTPWDLATQTAHARLETAVGGSRDGLWDWHIPSGRVFFSPRWRAILGYAEDDLEASFDTWLGLIHPEDLQATLDRVESALRGDVLDFENELRMRTRDGDWRWILARAAVVRGDDGAPLCLSGSHTDIHARKEAELEVERQRVFVTAVVDAIPNLVSVRDADGRFVLVNQPVAELYGTSKDALVGTESPSGEFAATGDGGYASADAQVLHTGQTVVGDDAITGADGVPRLFVTTRSPLILGGGEVFVLGTSVDVTEARRIETELRAAKEAAEAATIAKSQFLATMSHEIRTPMNGVLGMTELLLGTPLSADQKQLADTIRRSAGSLLEILTDVLDFSKIEAGRMDLERVPFDPAATIAEVVDLLTESAARKGLAFQVALGPGVTRTVGGDPTRLRQVLLNLASNAVKFTAAGHVTLRASVLGEPEDSVRLRFEVVDSGIGVPAETLPKLFQPFTQADGSTTRRYGGSGLGLAICKRLVDLMGGEIGATSSAGAGSTFWFEVPFRRVDGANAPVNARGRPPSNAPPSTKLSGRVLVVEDSLVNQHVAVRMLARLGVESDLAATGREAVTRAMSAPYDCILMDCHLPEMDGFEATKEIRIAAGDGPRVPIVALTASALPGERERCLEAGMDDYLTKPITLASLRRILERWVGERAEATP